MPPSRLRQAAWDHFVAKVDDELHDEVRAALAVLGRLDALLSLATLAQSAGYVQPQYMAGSTEIAIRGGRHPMAERLMDLRGRAYIANDAQLSCGAAPNRCVVVSGPNMGGKSSYVRMVALICLLGQIGAHVPADFASLPVLDQIFTRMGAGDDLASGQSTFMTELYRTSRILQHSTQRSLVILDELGRGTATFDGTAIAVATLQHIVDKIGCACLFVTHFPQVCDAADALSTPGQPAAASNAHMGYVETTDSGSTTAAGTSEVVFLHKLAAGRSGGSFGLNVARLAGMDADFLAVAAAKSSWMAGRKSGGGPGGGARADVMDVELQGQGQSKKRSREEPVAPPAPAPAPAHATAPFPAPAAAPTPAPGHSTEGGDDDKAQERKRLRQLLQETQSQLQMLEGGGEGEGEA